MRLNFLRGDVTRSGRVDALDLRRLVARLGTSLTKPGASPYTYDVFHDVTGDGKIDAFDWAAVRTGFFRGLPVGEPAVPAVQSPGNLSAPVVAISATRDLFGAEPILIR